MGRRSKFSDQQWQVIEKRLIDGETARALAREFKISEATIRLRFSAAHKSAKAVANQLVSAEQALRALPVSTQITALNFADDLRAISINMAGAGKFGAATAHRLMGIAHGQVAKIDDAAPLDEDSMEALRGIAALTKMANDSSVIPSGLLAANKETMRDAQAQKAAPGLLPSSVNEFV